MQMHPIRGAYNHWLKKAGPRTSFVQFARWLGYRDPDPLYRQMRGEYLTPPAKAKALAQALNCSVGRYYDMCAAYERAQVRRERKRA